MGEQRAIRWSDVDFALQLSPGQFREILAAAQRRSGLRRIKWHELRHSFASILTTGGAPLRIVQSLLGHSSIRMTERYAHLAPGQSAAFAHLRRRATASLDGRSGKWAPGGPETTVTA